MIISDRAFTVEEKREALDAVLKSATFARSDQLRRFLRYICEMEMGGRAHEINEYSIGTEALGRPADYTPGDDSSVRSRAYSLRQKLQEFYETERPGETIRIELRKGSYAPYFVARPELEGKPAAGAPKAPEKVSRRQWAAWAAIGGAGAALGFVGAVLGLRSGRDGGLDPTVREFWGPMLGPEANTVVCLASPPVMLLKSYREGEIPPQPPVNPVPKDVEEWYDGLRLNDRGGKVYMQSTMNDALLGDALAAAAAVRMLARAGQAAQVLPESGLRPLALRGRNVLLIGSPSYSRYAARILDKMPFSVRYDPVGKVEVISDGPAEGGAKRIYRPVKDEYGQLKEVFGLLTVVPSQAGGDDGARTAIFSGITSAGPQAAMEFFSSPAHLRKLKERLKREGYSKPPGAYQVVIRCGLDGTLALNWSYETHQVVRKLTLLD